MNKKGEMSPILLLFGIFAILLVLAFVSALGLALFKYGSNIITPVVENLGVINVGSEQANLSQAGEFTFGTLNTIVNVLPLLVGMGYFILLVSCIGIVVIYRTTANPIFLGLYLMLTVGLILVAILVSNAYENIYNGADVIALELQGMGVLSFLILYSPMIFGAVGFVSGIFLFSGKQADNVGGYAYG